MFVSILPQHFLTWLVDWSVNDLCYQRVNIKWKLEVANVNDIYYVLCLIKISLSYVLLVS